MRTDDSYSLPAWWVGGSRCPTSSPAVRNHAEGCARRSATARIARALCLFCLKGTVLPRRDREFRRDSSILVLRSFSASRYIAIAHTRSHGDIWPWGFGRLAPRRHVDHAESRKFARSEPRGCLDFPTTNRRAFDGPKNLVTIRSRAGS